MPIAALLIILNYQKARMKIKQSSFQDDSLTTTELQHLIDEAVADSTGDLSERIDNLEHQLRTLGPARTASIQDALDDVAETPEFRQKTVGKVR